MHQKGMIQPYTVDEVHFRFKESNKLQVKGGKIYSMQIATKKELGWLY